MNAVIHSEVEMPSDQGEMSCDHQPSINPIQPFLELGISAEQGDKALRYLRADGVENGVLQHRVRHLALLTNACGSLQNAKLAYSLASRSGAHFDDASVDLLVASVDCCDCVPAAVRLWNTARMAEVKDRELLVTAARLGADGTEIVAILNLLSADPERAELMGELARQLVAPGWEADGSWGGRPDLEHQLVWWDGARPTERAPYGMTLTSDPISLAACVGSKFLFQARWEILGVTDRCHLEVSADGKTWDKLNRYEGSSDWSEQEFDLRAYDGRTVRLRFHVLSGGKRQGRGFEMAHPRVEGVPVTHRLRIDFPALSEGWSQPLGEDRHDTLWGSRSESSLESTTLNLPAMESPTLTLEGRLMASSVYAQAGAEVLDAAGSSLLTLDIPSSGEWKSLRLPLESVTDLKIRLSARFNQRKDDDGLWVRHLKVEGGHLGGRRVTPIDGGGEDGERERQALLQLLNEGDSGQLRLLEALRVGMPSLRGALALLPLIREPQHVEVLLALFSQLKEEAIPAFSLLTSLSTQEDLALQAQVLLTSGARQYSSTRDYLGDGLLSVAEFEDNARIYLSLREHWDEQTARTGLTLLMTPVAEESLAQRSVTFRKVLKENSQPEAFFAAWESVWEHD